MAFEKQRLGAADHQRLSLDPLAQQLFEWSRKPMVILNSELPLPADE